MDVWINTISMVVIAVFAILSWVNSRQMKKSSTDLYQGLIIASIASTGRIPDEPSVRSALGWLKILYKERATIFEEGKSQK